MMKEENKLVKEKISREEMEIAKLHDQILAINAKIDEIENANSKINKKIKNLKHHTLFFDTDFDAHIKNEHFLWNYIFRIDSF